LKFDAIVVGSGAGGGIAACILAEAGKKVLLLERGRPLSFGDEKRDHLRNHRLAQYGHNTGPDIDGNPRLINGKRVNPVQGGYNNNASCVGGGTLVYGMQAWRFHPLDFKMASTYGVPDGSSLADWPISYDDLAPFYERAEWEIGVSGGDPAPQMPRHREYPMPGVTRTKKARALEQGCKKLGWASQTTPMLLNTVPRDGRGACIQCQHCVGFACPSDSKNGTQNTVIPRALASGNCRLESQAFVKKLTKSAGGRVTGVLYVDKDGNENRITADVVVLACGAIETARLLLNSGLGGEQVGRNLQGHYYAMASGFMPEPIYDGIGPGVSISTLEFNHGNDGVIGGGMMSDDFITMPIMFAKAFRPPEVPTWGQAHKDWMKKYSRFLQVGGPIHEIPSADCRVQVSSSVRDKFGVRVASLSGTTHPETVKTTKFMFQRAHEWLSAAGAESILTREPGLWLSAGQHQAGTCRMGEDPTTSVVDVRCRVHGHDNLFVTDSSVHVTNGGFNPVLTIMALSFRTSEGIVGIW
jgi:choline dehydrogenase-like flavoprotein